MWRRTTSSSDDGGYDSDAEKMLTEKNDETIAALIRGIEDVDRLLEWQRAAAELGRADVQAELVAQHSEEWIDDVLAAIDDVSRLREWQAAVASMTEDRTDLMAKMNQRALELKNDDADDAAPETARS